MDILKASVFAGENYKAAYTERSAAYNFTEEAVDMEDIKTTTSKKSKYRVRNVFPNREFSKPEQQKIAAQITKQLNLHKNSKYAPSK